MSMKIVRRILITLAVTLTVAFVVMYFASPIALSFYGSSKAIPITRIVPSDLKDVSVASAPGMKLSYLGYEFDVPWNVFEFSPDSMHHWALGPAVHAREQILLVTKSMVPSKSAESGIFNIRNGTYQGYQQGNPQAPPAKEDGVVVTLYSTDDTFELLVAEKKSTHLVTQQEINRIVRSLHKKAPASQVPDR